MAIGVAHELVRPLGCGIERDRSIDPIVDRKGELGVAAIDRTRTRVDQMLASRKVAAILQHPGMADEVGLNIVERMLNRVPDTGLGG